MEAIRNRIRVAQLSAQIIVEEGVSDYRLAKRKAAQRLGLDWGKNLPDDASITAALEEYHRIFRFHQQPALILDLRRTALEIMEFLEEFSPRLVGPVLEGTAGEFHPIVLHLFPDTPEEVIWRLLEAGIRYREQPASPIELDGRRLEIPILSLEWGGQAAEAHLYPAKALRLIPKHGPPRASIKAVRQLLTADPMESFR